jgi:hypothetical protein
MTKSSKDSCATITPPDKDGHNLAARPCARKGKRIALPLQGAAGEALTATRRAALPPEPLAASLPVGVVEQLERQGENHGEENWPDKLRAPGDDHL